MHENVFCVCVRETERKVIIHRRTEMCRVKVRKKTKGKKLNKGVGGGGKREEKDFFLIGGKDNNNNDNKVKEKP